MISKFILYITGDVIMNILMSPQGGDGGGSFLSSLIRLVIYIGFFGSIIYLIIRFIKKKKNPKIKKVKRDTNNEK